MIKIKAHSGDRLNDLADQLAKKAVQDGPRLNLKLTDILAVRMLMTCDDLEIEASSRRCIKHLFHAQNFSQFLLLRRAKEIYMLTEQHHIQWSATTRMLNNNQTDKDRSTTSFTQHRRRAFKYKLFINELPTLTQLNKRRPDLYKKPTAYFVIRKTNPKSTYGLAQYIIILGLISSLMRLIFYMMQSNTFMIPLLILIP